MGILVLFPSDICAQNGHKACRSFNHGLNEGNGIACRYFEEPTAECADLRKGQDEAEAADGFACL